jgi:hypothetical protein
MKANNVHRIRDCVPVQEVRRTPTARWPSPARKTKRSASSRSPITRSIADAWTASASSSPRR